MEILFRQKKDQSTDTWYKTDKPLKHYARWKMSDIKGRILYYPIYMKYPNRQIHRDRKKIIGYQGWGRVKRQWFLNWYRVSFWSDKKLLQLDEKLLELGDRAVQHCKCTEYHWTVHFIMVNFMIRKFYLIKKINSTKFLYILIQFPLTLTSKITRVQL